MYLPDEIRWLYEPPPTGVGHGDPGFVVGTDVSPARIALLDERARLLGYGIGEGTLQDAAVCPGAQKIVEVVRVSDSGRGLTKTDLVRVFERFYRADDQASTGTGVGLTIARSLVRAHGDEITASSPGLGKGAVFEITLPLG
ncbi:MAG: ATP-binding protein [bacterium]|nr:ATP-binding protein [bacterium]